MRTNSLAEWLDQIICGDAIEILSHLPAHSVDLVLTDPPYFLDKLDNEWTPERAARRFYKSQAVYHLPPGMKFDPNQGRRMYEWYLEVSRELIRVLKPGGFFFSFSSPRLLHRVACSVEDAGFHIRDFFLWLYTQNQPKAMGLAHFIEKMPLDEMTKQSLKKRLNGWKTPQVKSCYEPIIISQKPCEGTFLESMIQYDVGLFNTKVRVGQNMFPANVLLVDGIEEMLDKYFLVPKPSAEERGAYNQHQTVKPLALCEYLIQLAAPEGAVVLDPFLGSGTTAIAARNLKRHYIGIEINPEYVAIARKRLQKQIPSLCD